MNLNDILMAINTGIINTAKLKSRISNDIEEFGGNMTGNSSVEMLKRQIAMMRNAANEVDSEIKRQSKEGRK